MERYFDLVDDKGVPVEKDVAFPSLAHAYESYFKLHPEGLPKGWRIVDTSKPIIEKYVAAIKKVKPSFRKSYIKVHYDDILYSRQDMYIYVPFSYKGKEYEYREIYSSGKAWINEAPQRKGVDKEMSDKAQKLVDDLKKYYHEGDIPSAYSCWCKIYDLFEPKEDMTWEERKTLFSEQQKYISQVSDETVYAITNYGREKYYREQGYYGDAEQKKLTRIGIVYNHKGLCESNYIFTKENAFKTISTWLGEQEANKIIGKLEEIGFAAGEVSADKSYEIYDISDDERLRDFLNGEYNDSALDACLRNYNDLISIEDNYQRYSDWYWEIKEVSKEYEPTLGQYVGVAHSIPDFEEFKKIIADKDKSLDSVIDKAVDESKNTIVAQDGKTNDVKEYD